MRKRSWVVMFLGLASVSAARAEWVGVSGGIPEADIVFVAVSRHDASTLYAASSKRVYFSSNSGADWKQVLSVRGAETRIRHVLIDPHSPRTVYVASDKGLQKSEDAGKKWKWIYRGIGEKARAVYCVAEDPAESQKLWLGTGEGLVTLLKDGGRAQKAPTFHDTAVHSIWTGNAEEPMLVTSADGIYKSSDAGARWERVLAQHRTGDEDGSDQTLSQFQIEELSTGASFSNLIHVPAQNKYLAASAQGIFQAPADASSWERVQSARPVRYLAASGDSYYAATGEGVFQQDGSGTAPKDLTTGLPSKEVHMLHYHSFTQDLYAATGKGVYRFPKPDFQSQARPASTTAGLEEVLGRFRHEPTVLEIQQAAVRYAEVHPEKIESWRSAAAKKAWFPTFSVDADMDENQNVDLDRGGTGDPDRFIMGPEEESLGWGVGVSWNLGDLVWNDDQTSIDTRSKLMVELREDILNEVTHLYFERRRLQTDLVLAPPKELPLQIEKELKLQELTADIDALTGGFLSKRLAETNHAP